MLWCSTMAILWLPSDKEAILPITPRFRLVDFRARERMIGNSESLGARDITLPLEVEGVEGSTDCRLSSSQTPHFSFFTRYC